MNHSQYHNEQFTQILSQIGVIWNNDNNRKEGLLPWQRRRKMVGPRSNILTPSPPTSLTSLSPLCFKCIGVKTGSQTYCNNGLSRLRLVWFKTLLYGLRWPNGTMIREWAQFLLLFGTDWPTTWIVKLKEEKWWFYVRNVAIYIPFYLLTISAIFLLF